jgi:molybdate transport system substrate-binding protein
MAISRSVLFRFIAWVKSVFNAPKLTVIILVQLVFVGAVQAGEVKVFAAASLTDVLTTLIQSYEKANPGTVIKASFAGSSTLAKQIENGAPADLFFSADKDWADYLEVRSLLKNESRKNLLTNDLVIIAPIESAQHFQLEQGFNLIDHFTGKLCTGEPAHVPVGKYAKQVLEHYGWWTGIQGRLVGTEDVRTALAFVERGECALGIVYRTDAQMSKKVEIVATFPTESHLPIVYPGALTKRAGDDAQQFWNFLQTLAAINVFKAYGFIVAE